ncbi:helix-turn-helix domain-containing protein [Priestia aryabhattai]|uniref:helix-turn-helix domain-containing protein n=1 Tax=Priestia aryabhattai TaxID=412384 RepID=UPI002E25111A|nr:hypothetical protein [Priestia aryabhattai]
MSKVQSLVRSNDDIKRSVEMQMEFLKLIHPDSTLKDGYKDGSIEVRFLERFEDKKTSPLFSFSTWELNEESESYLYKRMLKYNGLTCCTYYSLYTFDRNLVSKGQPTFLNNDNAVYTQVLPMDFDDMGEEEFWEQKQVLFNLGIETLDVFSGHGYQSLILLKEKCYDKNLFEKFTKMMLRKGFNIDPRITDRGRIFRLPETFNCKQFQKGDKNFNAVNPKGINTYTYIHTTQRYDLKEVFELIETLPDVNGKSPKISENTPSVAVSNSGNTVVDTELKVEADFMEEVVANLYETHPELRNYAQEVAVSKSVEIEPEEEPKVYKTGNPKEKLNVQIKSKEKIAELYKHLDYKKLPEAIQNMLLGTPLGNGNDALLFLVPFLRNRLGLSLQKQTETLQVWGKECTPPWDEKEIKSEVSRLNKYDFKAQYGTYTKGLEELYGELVFNEWENKDDIDIPNEVFEKIKDISDGSFRLYLATRLLEHEEGRKNFTNVEIWERAGVAERTFKKHIPYLTTEKIFTKKKMDKYKKNNERYEYYVNPFNSSVKGFTRVKASLIELLLLKDLNDAQITFYIYLKHMVGASKDKSCWASQTYIAESLGKKSQTTISKLTDELHNKKIIRKETQKIGKVIHSKYWLLK